MTASAAGMDRLRSLSEEARAALGAVASVVSTVSADGQVGVLVWAPEPGSRYERALAAARRVVADFDPMRVRFDANVNQFVGNVHLAGLTTFGAFEDAARYTVGEFAVAIATSVLGLRWTLSFPLRGAAGVVGSFTLHFSDAPDDARRAAAESYARRLEGELASGPTPA